MSLLRGILRYLRLLGYFWRHGNDEHLFRGTSLDFPGGDALQQLGITSTTTDPLVATLFGMESSNHGAPGVVHIALRSRLSNWFTDANNYMEMEREVAVKQAPVDFAESAEFTVDVWVARQVLIEIGFQSIPQGIMGYAHLQLAISTTPRLNSDEIRSFLRIAIWRAQ